MSFYFTNSLLDFKRGNKVNSQKSIVQLCATKRNPFMCVSCQGFMGCAREHLQIVRTYGLTFLRALEPTNSLRSQHVFIESRVLSR